MDKSTVVVLFTDILKNAVRLNWEEAEISKLVLCLFQSVNKLRLSVSDMHQIIKKSKTICPEVLNILLEEEIVTSTKILPWILELSFDKVIEMLTKCFDEDTFTVLPEYENNILV